MSEQKLERCSKCKSIVVQVEKKGYGKWVEKQRYWSVEMIAWTKRFGDSTTTIRFRLCDKCKITIMRIIEGKENEP